MKAIFRGVSRHFEREEEDGFSANILWGGNIWMTKFMVKIAMNAGGGGRGIFDSGIFSNLVLAAGIFGRFDIFCPHSITSAVILLLK